MPGGRRGGARQSSGRRRGGRRGGSRRSSSTTTTTTTGGSSTTTVTTNSAKADPEALTGKRGSGYRGKQTRSKTGKKCTPWADSVTHTPKIYPQSGLESNFCRNPVPQEGAKTIWCFIEGGTPRNFWEYCEPVQPEIKRKTVETTTVKSSGYRPIYGESSLGCYKDAGQRDLPNLIRAGYGNPAKCFKMAMDAGYQYVGMQYRGECWGGNSMGRHGKRPDSECNMRCKYDNSRMCGAGWRNNIFKLVKTEVTITYKAIFGETREGCFKDSGNRDLPNLLRAGYGSPRNCFQKAMDAGYKYAGLQYRGECWAGNSFGKYGKRPESECNMKCRNDNSRTCGAGWRNEVFRLKEVAKPKPVAAVYKSLLGESYFGCFKDAGRRDLPKLLRAGYGDPRRCF
jgi:hypothetical protein